ncbi:MAG: hypothetical protein ACLSH3_15920 [Alistipes finegoldii]
MFELTEMEGFTFRELAEDTGIPVATSARASVMR